MAPIENSNPDYAGPPLSSSLDSHACVLMSLSRRIHLCSSHGLGRLDGIRATEILDLTRVSLSWTPSKPPISVRLNESRRADDIIGQVPHPP